MTPALNSLSTLDWKVFFQSRIAILKWLKKYFAKKNQNPCNKAFPQSSSFQMTTETFIEMTKTLRERLFREAYRILRQQQEAEDVVQEVLLKLWEKRSELDAVRNHEAWCVRLTQNAAIDRTRLARHRYQTEMPEYPMFNDTAPNPHQRAELQDSMQQIHRCVEALPDVQAKVLRLRDMEGLSYQEITKILELTLQQVRVYLHRARKQVREQFLQMQRYEKS